MASQITASLLRCAGAVSAPEAAALRIRGKGSDGGLLLFMRRGDEVLPLDVDPSSTVHGLLAEARRAGLLLDGERVAFGGTELRDDVPLADTGICSESTLTVLCTSVAPKDIMHSNRIDTTEYREERKLVATVANRGSGCCLQLVGPSVAPTGSARWVVVMNMKPANNGYFVGLTSADADTFDQRREDASLEKVTGTSFNGHPQGDVFDQVVSVMLPDQVPKLEGRHFSVCSKSGDSPYSTGDAIVICKTADEGSARVSFKCYRQKSFKDPRSLLSDDAPPPHVECAADLTDNRHDLYLTLVLFNETSQYTVFTP